MPVTIDDNHFNGGQNMQKGHGRVGDDLAAALRAAAADLAESTAGKIPVWTETITVTTHVAVLAEPGFVLAVEGTTGDSTGGKAQQLAGSPAAGTVQVEYDADGIATLTFNATDNLTVAAVVLIPRTAAYTVQLLAG